MNVREEDKEKNCTGRGFGLAAAAIGVGVGAALFYMFSKRPESEHPDTEGSTSAWERQHAQALRQHEALSALRQQQFRERTWTLEECSICFDVMLRDQEIMSLPCTHNFHAACLMPWLQEKQTCPNCRKSAD